MGAHMQSNLVAAAVVAVTAPTTNIRNYSQNISGQMSIAKS
jgi:hypothetical protein